MVNRTLNAIIDGFNKLITETDFHKISVDMIMKEAGVSRSTFYRYFKDKYDVMNANYKMALDYYLEPERSSNYRDLCFHLFDYGQRHLKVFRRALESTGFNSLSNFIYEYSYNTALKITRLRRLHPGGGTSGGRFLQRNMRCLPQYGVPALSYRRLRRCRCPVRDDAGIPEALLVEVRKSHGALQLGKSQKSSLYRLP